MLIGVPLTHGGRARGRGRAQQRHRPVPRLLPVGFYLPVVTSIVAVAVVWKFLLRTTAAAQHVLGWVGIDGPGWLDRPDLALPSLIVMAVWRNFGTLMVIFLAGLQTIPRSRTRPPRSTAPARGQRFRHITLPMLRPTLLFGAVITTIGYLQFFEEAFVMTKGGPLDSTLSVTYFTFDQFGFGNYGYAAAASYLLFLADRRADAAPVPAAAREGLT